MKPTRHPGRHAAVRMAVLLLTAPMLLTACGGSSGTPGEPHQTPRNLEPIAEAGEDAAVGSGTKVTLEGEGTDPGNDTVTYTWEQIGQGPRVALSDAAVAQPTFTAPAVIEETTLTFELTVVERGGLVSRDTVQVVVTNTAPVADAGYKGNGSPGSTITLNGSASTDPGGGKLTYAWVQTAGPRVRLSDATAVNPTFTAPAINRSTTLTFELTVTDAAGMTAKDTVQWRIAHAAPVADVGGRIVVDPGGTVTLDGSASRDPGDGRLTYSWRQTGGPSVVLSAANVASPTFTAPGNVTVNTTLTFELTVTSAESGLTATDTVQVIVAVTEVEPEEPEPEPTEPEPTDPDPVDPGTTDPEPTRPDPTTPNRAPVAEAGDDDTVDERATFTFDGSGTDADGDTLTYAWTAPAGVTLTGADTAAPSFTAPGVDADTPYIFTLTVSDASEEDTDEVTITVRALPEADAGDDDAVDEGDMVTLDGSDSTGPVGDTLTHAWTAPTGVTLTGADTTMPTFTAPNVTTDTPFVFTLTFSNTTDTTSDTDTVTITVRPQQPEAHAGSDDTVDEREEATLDGSNSTGPAGDTLTYAWTAPTGVTLAGANTAAPTFTVANVDADTEYTFTLTFSNTTDNTSDTDTVTITVRALPEADAGSDDTVDGNRPVTLDGSGSEGPAGDTLTYAWAAPTGVTLTGANTAAPTFTAPDVTTQTTYTFTLTYTNTTDTTSDTDTVVITVNPAATANAGADQGVQAVQRVMLDGSASTGPGGTAVTSYAWTQATPTGTPTIELSNAAVARPTFFAPVMLEGATLTFTLTVTATGNLTHADEVTITVEKAGKETLGTIRGMSISDDGSRAVSGGTDGFVRLWDLSAGMEVRFDHDTIRGGRSLGGHDGEVYAVAISGDGKRAISGGADGVLHVWYTDPDTAATYGNEVFFQSPQTGAFDVRLASSGVWIYAVAMNVDGTRAASGGFDGVVRFWNSDSAGALGEAGAEITYESTNRSLGNHGDNSVYALSLSNDGSRLLSGGADGTVRLWNTATTGTDPAPGTEIRQLADNDGNSMGQVFSVAISGDGNTAAAGSADNHARVWAASDGTMERHELDHDADVTGVSLNTDGTRLLSTDGNGNVRLWNVESGDAGDGTQIHAARRHTDYVWTASLSGVDKTAGTAITGGADGLFNVWDDITTAPSDNTEAFTTTPSEPPNIDPAQTGDMIPVELSGHTDIIRAVALSADGSRALSGSGSSGNTDNTVRFWDTTTRTEITFPDGAGGTRHLASHESTVESVSLSANGRIALSGGDNHGLNVWDTATGQLQRNLLDGRTDNISIRDASLSADGRLAFSASRATPDNINYTGSVELFDTVTGTSLHRETNAIAIDNGHTGISVEAAALSADGRFALSGGGFLNGDDRTVRLWRTNPFTEVRRPIIGVDGPPYLGRHGTYTDGDETFGGVFGVALSADGSFALSGGQAREVHFYNTATRDRIVMDQREEVGAVSLSADGRLALATSIDGPNTSENVRLWHPATGTLLRTSTVHGNQDVLGGALNADGRIALTGDSRGKLYLWHIGRSRGPSVPTVTAVVGQDRTEAPLAQVVLDGSDSADAKGNKPIAYSWRQASGEPTVTLSDKNVAAPTFIAPGVTATTTLTFELSVTGADGLVDTSQVTITINPALAAHAGPDQRVAFGASVTLDGSASHDPAGGTPTYAWTAPAGITLTGADTASPTFTAPANGSADSILLVTLTFTLTVTDGSGNTAQDSVAIGVGEADTDINALYTRRGIPGRSAVRSVAFGKGSSTNIPVAVVGSLDGTVNQWILENLNDPEADDDLALLGSYEGAAYAVAISGNRIRAIAGGIDGIVRVWDSINSTPVQHEVGDGKHVWVYAVAISQDGTRAATAGFDGKIRLWNLTTLSSITEITYGSDTRSLGDHGNHSVYALSMSDDGTRLLSGGADGTVRLWNTETTGTGAGTALRTFETADGDPTGQIFGVALSGDGQIAVAGAADNNVHVWDTATGEELYDLKGHTADVSSVALSGDKTRVLSGGGDGTVRLWNVDVSDAEAGGSQIYSRRLHSDYVWSVALHDAAGLALSGGADTKLNLWRTNEPPPDITEPFATVEQDRDPAFTGDVRLQPLGAHESDVTDVALTKDGRFAVSVGDTGDRTARLWNAITGDLLHVISFGTGPLNFAERVVLSADGRLVAFGRHDQFVSFWTIEEDQANGTTKLVSLRNGPTTGTGVVDDLSMTPDGRLAISGDRVGDARMLDPHTGQEILFGGSSFYDGTQILSVGMSADGEVVLLGDAGTENQELLWTGVDASAGTRTAQTTRTKNRDVGQRDIRLNADGSRAVITFDLTIIFRDLATGTGDDLHTAEVDSLSTVASAAMTLDARLALTGAQGGRTWLWDAANHEVLRRFQVGVLNLVSLKSVRGASLSADGRIAVTDDSEGTVYIQRFDRSDAAAAPPTATAVAGADQTTTQSTAVTLNGSCSSDSRGTELTLTGCSESYANTSKKPLAYYWRQTAGTDVTLSANNVAAPTFTTPGADGTLTFELTVTDALGLIAKDDITVTVSGTSSGKAPGRLTGTGRGGASLTASNALSDAHSSHPRGGAPYTGLANARDAQSAADGACISRITAAGETLHGTARGIHCVYPAAFADVDNPLAEDTTIPALPAGGAHIFAGSLVVGDADNVDTGPALTVSAGAILAFEGASSSLVVNPGARLLAVGTAGSPITLTSVADVSGAEAYWNGLVIHGDGADAGASGRLEYVVVKHAGSDASSASINLHNVAGATAIANLQVYAAPGDGLAVVGGAATIDNFVAVYVHGNSIGVSADWSGAVTNALVIQPEHGGEHCLDASDTARGTISGLTCITSAHTGIEAQGPNPGLGAGIRLGANTALTIERSVVVGTFADDTDERTNYCLGIDSAASQTAATLDGNVFACADQANSAATAAWATTRNNQFANIPAPTDPTAATDTHLQLLGGTPPVYSLDYQDLRIDGADTTVTPPNGADFPGAASESAAPSWLRPGGIDWTYGIFQGSRPEPLWFEAAR